MTERELVIQTETKALGKKVDLHPCSPFDLGLRFFCWGKLNSLPPPTVTLGQNLPQEVI